MNTEIAKAVVGGVVTIVISTYGFYIANKALDKDYNFKGSYGSASFSFTRNGFDHLDYGSNI